MALACQEKTSPIDRKMYKKTNFRLNPWKLGLWLTLGSKPEE
jgi:hypothetical protein